MSFITRTSQRNANPTPSSAFSRASLDRRIPHAREQRALPGSTGAIPHHDLLAPKA